MEPGQYALIFSGISVIISVISLGWTIRRDVLRPRVKVDFGVGVLVSEKGPEDRPYLSISGTNFGPGEVQLTAILLRPKWTLLKKIFGRKVYWGYLIRDYRHPYSAKMPCVVQVGERKVFFLVYDRNCFLKEKKYVGIGISDSFGRIHWASKKSYKIAQNIFEKETWEYEDDERAQG